jgi:two-component sensor histidine kinase
LTTQANAGSAPRDDGGATEELRRIAASICALSGADRAAVLAYDASTDGLHGPGERGGEIAFPVHHSPLAVRAAVGGVPVYATEVDDRPDRGVPLLGFPPIVCLPLVVRDRLVGIAYLGWTAGGRPEADPLRLREIGDLAALALEAVRRTVPAAGGDERFARALHDGVLQTLCTIVLETERVREPVSADARLERIRSLARAGTDELREALAALGGASPQRTRLELGLSRLVADAGARAGGLAIDVEIDERLRHRDDAVADALYRTCREGLANVVRHARASDCHIRCRIDDGWAVATVEDDGVGSGGETGSWHFGLAYLRGLVEGLGGDVELRPREPKGTVLLGRVPLDGDGAQPTG